MAPASLSSSTIRPTRHHSLAEKSFFGKLATKLDEFEELPDDTCDVCDEPELPEDSILAIPEPTLDLAARAEQMRSSIISRRPDASTSRVDGSVSRVDGSVSRVDGSVSRVTFAPEPSAVAAAAPPPHPDISEGDDDENAVDNRRTGQKPKTKLTRGSMMTHPPSRTVTVAGRGAPPAGGTFGSIPRFSPSGTMPHHAPRALPTPAAMAAVQQRPRSARARLEATASATAAESREGPSSAAAQSRPSSAQSRPSSARGSQRSDPAHDGAAAAAAAAEPAFAVAAKGGALAWRPPSAATKPRERPAVVSRQEKVRAEKAAEKADNAVKKGSPFAFAVVCCGDEFEGYCCKRHHPSDEVVCCSLHAPVCRPCGSSSMAKSRDSIASRYASLMRETAAEGRQSGGNWRA